MIDMLVLVERVFVLVFVVFILCSIIYTKIFFKWFLTRQKFYGVCRSLKI